MARPLVSGISSFPLDVDIFADPKLLAITAEFGAKGELTVIRLLCAIYRNGYFIEWTDRNRTSFMRTLTGISSGLADAIVHRLVKVGFFDEELFRTASVLTSHGIQRRYFDTTRRRRIPADAPYLIAVPAAPIPVPSSPSAPLPSASQPAPDTPDLFPASEFFQDLLASEPSAPPSAPVSGASAPPPQQPPSLAAAPPPSPQQPPSLAAAPPSSPPPAGASAPPAPSAAALLQPLRTPSSVTNGICRRYHIDHPQLVQLLDDFILDCQCRAKDHYDQHDALNHFNNWLRIITSRQQYPSNNAPNSITSPQDRRRSVQPDISDPTAYETSF